MGRVNAFKNPLFFEDEILAWKRQKNAYIPNISTVVLYCTVLTYLLFPIFVKHTKAKQQTFYEFHIATG
jgi:hypothetical protein